MSDAVFETLGFTEDRRMIVAIDADLHRALVELAYILVGQANRPPHLRPGPNYWPQAAEALGTFIGELVKEVGYSTPATIPSLVVTKTIEVAGRDYLTSS